MTILLARWYGTQREKHWGWLGFLLSGTLDDFHNLETVAFVERDRVGFRIYEQAHAAELLPQLLGELDAEPKEGLTQSSSPGGFVHRESSDA